MAQRPQCHPGLRAAEAEPPEEDYEEQPDETPETVEGDPGTDLPDGEGEKGEGPAE